MEENGLQGAMKLIEQLFDERPGDDLQCKNKMKRNLKRGMDTKEKYNNVKLNKDRPTTNLMLVPSEEMIYKNAVSKRVSSSTDEDGLDLSNESNLLTNLVLGEDSGESAQPLRSRTGDEHQKPSTSEGVVMMPDVITPELQGHNMTRLAEKAMASLFPPQGEMKNLDINSGVNKVQKGVVPIPDQFKYVAQMDQDYAVVGAHIDDTTQEKIKLGQYVDFSKLLPRDKILTEEDSHMELVIRNGKTYWVLVSEGINICNFNRWEQAFRVYSNIYTQANPERAGQLIEYNHIIHSIASAFTWENVYEYDKEFRLHIAKHPQRSWAIILQQAWSMRLRDRLFKSEVTSQGFSNTYQSSAGNTPGGEHSSRNSVI